MITSPVRALASLICFSLLLACLAVTDWAHSKEVVVRLYDATNRAPSHLCLVAAAIADLTPGERAKTSTLVGVNWRLSNGEVPTDQMTAEKLVEGLQPQTQMAEPTEIACGYWLADDRISKNSWALCPMPHANSICTLPRPYEGVCGFSVDQPPVHPKSDAKGQATSLPDAWISCHRNELVSTARGHLGVVVLGIGEARVNRVRLTGDIARIDYEPTTTEKDATLTVRVLGGHYRSSTAAARQAQRSGTVELPLVPRCSEETVRIPKFECAVTSYQSTPKPCDDLAHLHVGDAHVLVSRSQLSDELTIPVPSGEASLGRYLKLSACISAAGSGFAHEFSVQVRDQQAGQGRDLVPTRLEFSWRRNPLVEGSVCPFSAKLPERGISCSTLNSQDSLCSYRCFGNLSLPSVVQFELLRPNSTGEYRPPQRWQQQLTRAGEQLDAFVSESEREVELHWTTPSLSRAMRWGDRIEYLQLRSADGQTYRLLPDASHLRVPGVERGDKFSYTFIGDRSFNEDTAEVNEGGKVSIGNPDELFADGIVFATSFSSGLKYIGSDASAKWSPYAEVGVIASIRSWRWRPDLGNFYLDPEFRLSAIVTTEAYASRFLSPRFSDDWRWESAPMMMFPIEAMLHAFGNQPLHFSVGGGILLSREVLAHDADRISNSVKWAVPHFSAGVGITRTFAIDFDLRWIHNNHVVRRTFDDAGLRQLNVDTTGMVLIGLGLRWDDFFSGTRVRPTERKNQASAEAPRNSSEQSQVRAPAPDREGAIEAR